MSDRLAVAWRPREPPLAPVALAAVGEPARELARRLLRRPERLPELRLLAGSGVLFLAGAPDELPWVDGVSYLGRHAEAPALLLPTNLAPDAPLPLVERALLRRLSVSDPPVAVLPAHGLLIATGSAQPAQAEDLAAWLATP